MEHGIEHGLAHADCPDFVTPDRVVIAASLETFKNRLDGLSNDSGRECITRMSRVECRLMESSMGKAKEFEIDRSKNNRTFVFLLVSGNPEQGLLNPRICHGRIWCPDRAGLPSAHPQHITMATGCFGWKIPRAAPV